MKSKSVCLDASVVVASLLNEKETQISVELLTFLKKNEVQVICPNIFILEITAAIYLVAWYLSEQDKELVLDNLYCDGLLTTVELFTSLISFGVDIIKDSKVKGMDSAYIAVASHLDIPLVTFDKLQLQGGKNYCEVFSPEEYIGSL